VLDPVTCGRPSYQVLSGHKPSFLGQQLLDVLKPLIAIRVIAGLFGKAEFPHLSLEPKAVGKLFFLARFITGCNTGSNGRAFRFALPRAVLVAGVASSFVVARPSAFAGFGAPSRLRNIDLHQFQIASQFRLKPSEFLRYSPA